MVELMSVDFAAYGAHWAMLTLTYPAEFARDPRSWRRDLSAFRNRWSRRWREPMRAFVALEWQRPRRKGANKGERAPHWHVLHLMPPGTTKANAKSVETWARSAWHDVVTKHRSGLDGDAGTADRCAHLWFGARLTTKDNAAKAARYLVGELTRASKARQKELPPEWSEGMGRWWYRWSLDTTEALVEVSQREYEVLRWWLRRIAHHREYHVRFRSRYQGLALYDRGPTAWRLQHWTTYVLAAMRFTGATPSKRTWARLLTFPCACVVDSGLAA